jgi:hypothetical protein
MALIKHGNNALSSVTAFPSAVPTGKPVLLSTATASASSSVEFTFNNSYDIHHFEYTNIHPSTSAVGFQFQCSSDGTNFNKTITSTYFVALHYENDAAGSLNYNTGNDQAQGTSFQNVVKGIKTDNDASSSGYVTLFGHSSPTYVKHFVAECNFYGVTDYSGQHYAAGYFNTTDVFTNIKFQMSSGTFDGTIKMYGISA